MTCPNVLQKKPLGKKDVSDALGVDWHLTAKRLGKGAFADKIGVGCTETINNAITGKHVPELHTALNSLIADPAALFNTFQLFGGCFVAVSAEAVNDNEVIATMLRTATEYFERLKDGRRCPRDTAALAELLIPLVPALLAIIKQARDQ